MFKKHQLLLSYLTFFFTNQVKEVINFPTNLSKNPEETEPLDKEDEITLDDRNDLTTTEAINFRSHELSKNPEEIGSFSEDDVALDDRYHHTTKTKNFPNNDLSENSEEIGSLDKEDIALDDRNDYTTGTTGIPSNDFSGNPEETGFLDAEDIAVDDSSDCTTKAINFRTNDLLEKTAESESLDKEDDIDLSNRNYHSTEAINFPNNDHSENPEETESLDKKDDIALDDHNDLPTTEAINFVTSDLSENSAESGSLDKEVIALGDHNDHTTETINFPNNDLSENPEETGSLREGDIALEDRNGVLSGKSKWAKQRIPYIIKGSFSKKELSIINYALNQFHQNTCLRFQKRKNEKDYLVITNKPNGCWSNIGRLGERQEVNLESMKCFINYGTTIHELMRTIGFYHEQNRSDRDDYVKILWENIKKNLKVNFEKLKRNIASGYGVKYDYGSIMHYKATSFSKNGKPTMKALKANQNFTKMGQRKGFSVNDIKKINKMYKC